MKFSLRILLATGLALLAGAAAHAQTLSPTGISASPSSALPGDSVTFAITANNSQATQFGPGATANFTIVFTHLITGSTFTVGPVSAAPTSGFIGATVVDPTTGQRTPGIGTFTITSLLPTQTIEAGNYRATVTLNSVTSGTVGTPAFSVGASVLTITGRPDLAITRLDYAAGTTYVGGQTLAMSLDYVNNQATNGTQNVPYRPGVGGAPAFVRVQVVLSSNPAFGDADDFQLTFHDIATYTNANGSANTISWTQLLPGNFTGSYYVLAKIDSLNALPQNDPAALTVNGNNVWTGNTLNPAGTLINLVPSNFPTAYLASHGAGATTSSSGYSDNPSITADGRYVAFASDASNLISGDSNAARDIFIFDSQTSLVRRISVSQQGSQGNGASNNPAISSQNGRYVAFASDATNLVLGDTNGFSDIFVVDTLTGLINRVSGASASGGQANNPSFRPAISQTGRYIVFESTATNLTATSTAVGVSHVYIYDRDVSNSGTFDTAGNTSTRIIDVDASAPTTTVGNAAAIQATISADASWVAFSSKATNLVTPATTAARQHVYVRATANIGTATSGIKNVSVANGTITEGSADSQTPSLSSNGRYVAFASLAANLVAGDANAVSDVFVYDNNATLPATVVRRVSVVHVTRAEAVDPSPAGFRLGSINPTISADGRYVAFASLANNLTAGDSNGQVQTNDANRALDIFVHDRDSGAGGTFDTVATATQLVSVNPFGYQTNGLLGVPSTAASNIYPVISANGRFVAFPTDAESTAGLAFGTTNLLPLDSNGLRDVFLFDRRTNATVTPATPPTVTITSPGNGGTSLVNTTFPITASATTTVGVVSNVQFFVNGVSLGTSTVFPYSASWRPTAVGTYTLSALVTDSFGNLGASANVTVTINAAPSVGVTSPVAGSAITSGTAQTVTATAAATTPGATITSVQFLANGITLGTDTTAPYTAAWTPTSAGSYALTAIATDSFGTQTTSPAVAITVNAPGGGGGGGLTAPTIAITTPADGSSIPVNLSQNVSATASLLNGTVTSVAFSANGAVIGSATSFPYNVQWTPATAGTFTLTAVATGSNGASATTVNTITVVSAGSPTVALTSPLGGSVLPINTPTAVFATAADADGTIRNVQFFANGLSIGTAATFPYNTNFTPTSPGIYVLTAIATDNVGNRTTSAAISVTVSGGTAPNVAITAPAAGGTVGVNLPQTITATASSSGGFIGSVQFLVNGVALATDSAFPYATVWTPAAVGTYTLTSLATDNSGNVATSAPITVTVSASAPPSVNVTNPVTGSAYTVGASLNITANAADSDGTITQVAFFVNGVQLSVDTTSPYASSAWTPGSTGVYTLTALATDNTGNVTTSAPVTVTIGANAAPTVAITSPSAGLSFSLGNNVLIAAAAADSDGTVASVQFFANGLSIGSVSSAPYSFSWKPSGAGTFALTAVATDNAGNSTTGAAVSVTVTASAAPLVSITNPATGATFGVGTTVPLNATATGGNGPISQVQFFVNGALLATDSAAPYNAPWTPASAGTYSLLAVATDSGGISGTSTAVTVVISPNGAPTVTLVSPGTNLVVGLGTVVNLSATASDSDGTIASVRFLANGTVLASGSALPYTTGFRPTAPGVYTVIAQATDNSGNVADSVAQTITVLGGNVPIVTLGNPAADTTISADSSLLLAATASIGTGTINRVEFYAGATLLATRTASPYSYVWRPAASGSYAIRAVAYDANGTGVSSSVSIVTVGAARAAAGAFYVNITNPGPASTVVAFRNITLSAVTNVSEGTSTTVDFYANGSLIRTVTAEPFQFTFSLTIPGTFEFYAVVRSTASAYTSAPVNVTVLANAAPSVVITAPNTGSTVNVGSAVSIRATATDPDDQVDTVRFLVNGQILSTSSAFPYSAAWTPTSEGIYTLTAIAKDSQGSTGGNQTTSAPVYVRVAAPASAGGSGANAPDVVYAGTYAGGSEFGKFAVISVGGKSAAFIGHSTTGAVKTYFYPGLPLDTGGGFSSGTALSGRVNDTGVSGNLDNNRLTFIGPITFASGSKIASGYYTGNIANRSASTLAAIIAADGSMMAYVSDGSFSDAGSGSVDSAGGFSLTLAGGSRIVGRADPATGFLSGTLTGGPGGTFMAALASGGAFSDGSLRNLSTRGQVGTGNNVLIAGFVVGGTTPKQVLVRAIGPTLSGFGITGALADSQVELFRGTTRVALNDNWNNAPALSAAASVVGAFPLAANSLDAVILALLDPGAYTAQVSGTGGRTGVALVELYDVDTVTAFSPQKVTNVSTRGVVGTGENILIAGFVVGGTTPKRVLVRGVGPGLASLLPAGSNPGALTDPILQIIRSDRTVVRENDNWETGNDAALVIAATTSVGGFPLARGSRDSVILISLPPGTYSATVSGVGGATGVGIVEVYEVP